MRKLITGGLRHVPWKKVFIAIIFGAFMLGVISLAKRLPTNSSQTTSQPSTRSKYEQTSLPTISQPTGSLRVIVEPDDHMQTIYRAVESAKTSIDIVIYELDDAKFEELLAQKASEKVSVRVILNKTQAFSGQTSPRQKAALDYLTSHGVLAKLSSSRFTYTHQKTIVIDHQTAIIMTMNLAEKYYATSRDFGVIISSPPDISAIEQTFDADWTDKPIPSQNGDDLLWSPGAETAMIALINQAQKTLDVYNEEMYDTDITNALVAAEKRGVQVRIVMNYSTGEKSVFNTLVQSGVLLRTYSSSSKNIYIHAKVILADNAYAIIGSQNFSWTSLEKNRELGIFVNESTSLQVLKKVFEADYKGARIYKVKK